MAAPKLSPVERNERRRAEILRAARACVRAEGFHAATMSRIAEEASMGPGQIYQYYENKEAVMVALAQKDMDEFMSDLQARYSASNLGIESIVEIISEEVFYIRNHGRALIAREIYAESARNANFSELVLQSGDLFRRAIREMIRPILRDCSEEDLQSRVETLLILTRSIAVAPQKHSDQILTQGFELAIRGVLAQ